MLNPNNYFLKFHSFWNISDGMPVRIFYNRGNSLDCNFTISYTLGPDAWIQKNGKAFGGGNDFDYPSFCVFTEEGMNTYTDKIRVSL